ncbi:hypothetical protein B0H17DRAFT_569687 [Mycena rosella]|uniref:Uncharacterized protein n=1 Tax=Mycena rosella TaxID=1033263 RepID=A0AAD7GWR7_MYCRO|nr:hypothetical protein B0H17DRAFT_569687 [Mycena rosella]
MGRNVVTHTSSLRPPHHRALPVLPLPSNARGGPHTRVPPLRPRASAEICMGLHAKVTRAAPLAPWRPPRVIRALRPASSSSLRSGTRLRRHARHRARPPRGARCAAHRAQTRDPVAERVRRAPGAPLAPRARARHGGARFPVVRPRGRLVVRPPLARALPRRPRSPHRLATLRWNVSAAPALRRLLAHALAVEAPESPGYDHTAVSWVALPPLARRTSSARTTSGRCTSGTS